MISSDKCISQGKFVYGAVITVQGIGRGHSSLAIVNEGNGSFSGKPYFQGEP